MEKDDVAAHAAVASTAAEAAIQVLSKCFMTIAFISLSPFIVIGTE
jgi:hypothetical protein